VEEHRSLVRQLSETQQEISQTISEQTKLLYALQPRLANDNKPDPTRN
jgi:septal ring factor EnvC (AmiA/AmiB activator)